ncbi:MAG TPA: L-arabinose isomerase [Bacteroidales bacterium]|nr:L-arabinose isomerase [Bacteroidales bacterium]
MSNLKKLEVWFITGSQHLYGESTLKKVAGNAGQLAAELNDSRCIPVKVVFKPVLTDPGSISALCLEANAAQSCIGLIAWMHTFSPAQMWIAGLSMLRKPLLHLHTQFNRDIPWDHIDMDFMNLNQSAHGGREFGFMMTRMKIERKVVVGHWKEKDVQEKIGIWTRAAAGWHEFRYMKIARFGDNMREVAVTEGDKVEARMQFGFAVQGFGVGDLAEVVKNVKTGDVHTLVETYKSAYQVDGSLLNNVDQVKALESAARIELGMRRFLEAGGFKAFTTTFEDLHGIEQLPGLAVQRLMNDGYGFGAEGDWKTAALVRAVKVMSEGLEGGTSFMEDYTYHLQPGNMKVLGAHMLEVCPSISSEKPSLEVHPLSIGGKSDPARLVFNVPAGPAINASLMDMGNRFRLLVNRVKVVPSDAPLPRLPVARVLWVPKPDLQVAAAAWIYAGGAHHSVFSQAVNADYLEDFAAIAGIEYLLINEETRLRDFKNELRWNDLYYAMKKLV